MRWRTKVIWCADGEEDFIDVGSNGQTDGHTEGACVLTWGIEHHLDAVVCEMIVSEEW